MPNNNPIDKANSVRSGETLDWEKLENYLREQIPQLQVSEPGQDMKVAQFHGGHANLTYLLTFGDIELVMRRPPFGKIAPGAHDMGREYRVLSKLYRYFPAAPKAWHLCEDETIIGAKFIVMERKTGVVVRTKILDCFRHFENAEQRISKAMIKAQADLHLVSYEQANLTNLGKPEGFLQRQLKGWTERWQLSRTSDSTAMGEVWQWLHQDIPNTQHHSIIHNDIKPDNCQFQADNPDQVTAIFDWDMCTLGDPLLDFASTLSYWSDARFDTNKYSDLPVTLEGNFPNKNFLIEHYQQCTGFDLHRLQWYEVFAYAKGVVISLQLYKRYVDGHSSDERMQRFGQSAQAMTDLTMHIIESS